MRAVQHLACMPLKKNIGADVPEDWELAKCPDCGADCYRQPWDSDILKIYPGLKHVCTECAIKAQKER